MIHSSISATVLAGGTAKRLGGIVKSKILIGRETIISKMMGVLEEIFSEIIIVTSLPDEFEEFRGNKIISDLVKGKGPLAGIHTAIESMSGEAVFVFGGDMPFISKKIICDQIAYFKENECDALVPMIMNETEPLHAVYNISIKNSLTSYLNGNSDVAIREFLKTVNTRYMKMDDTNETRLAFTNINTPADILLHNDGPGHIRM